jgi:hypothetical protein
MILVPGHTQGDLLKPLIVSKMRGIITLSFPALNTYGDRKYQEWRDGSHPSTLLYVGKLG